METKHLDELLVEYADFGRVVDFGLYRILGKKVLQDSIHFDYFYALNLFGLQQKKSKSKNLGDKDWNIRGNISKVLNISSINTGPGINGKRMRIRNYLHTNNIHILHIQETDGLWGNSNPFQIDGYISVYSKTPKSNPLKPIRVISLYREDLFEKVKVRDDLMGDEVDNIWLELNFGKVKYLTGNFYRPWLYLAADTSENSKLIRDSIDKASSNKNSMLAIHTPQSKQSLPPV